MEWSDISTAPRDGCYLVANAKGEVCSCNVQDGRRLVNNCVGYADWTWGEAATHWMPLPPPPVIAQTALNEAAENARQNSQRTKKMNKLKKVYDEWRGEDR